MTHRGVSHITKMKKNILNDIIYQTPISIMEVQIQSITFIKHIKCEDIVEHARIIACVDEEETYIIVD